MLQIAERWFNDHLFCGIKNKCLASQSSTCFAPEGAKFYLLTTLWEPPHNAGCGTKYIEKLTNYKL